jgi:CRISPR/Cas system CMR-associated protein Cmr3 (group 5 of RAMP superfamily)
MQKMISRSIYNLKIDTICMYDIPVDRSILQLSNGIRHVMPSTDRKLEVTAKASMAQPVSQPAVCSNGLITTNKSTQLSETRRQKW